MKRSEVRHQARRTAWPRALIALIGVVAAAAAVLIRSGTEAPPATWPGAATIPEPVVACSAVSVPLARARAAEREATAQAWRYPFAPELAGRVLALLREAQDCYAAAGLPEQTHRLRSRAEAWRATIEHDLHTLRLRLKRALARHDLPAARSHAAALLSMPGDRTPAYRRWLAHVRQGGTTP